MNKHRVYFAHPINTYGTPLERTILGILTLKWRGDTIVNPGSDEHRAVVDEMRRIDPSVNVMGYFTELVKACNEVVVLPFIDGMWGAGVYKEAETVLDLTNGRYVWVINPTTHVIRFVPRLKESLRLTVEETRSRIRLPDGSPRPYA